MQYAPTYRIYLHFRNQIKLFATKHIYQTPSKKSAPACGIHIHIPQKISLNPLKSAPRPAGVSVPFSTTSSKKSPTRRGGHIGCSGCFISTSAHYHISTSSPLRPAHRRMPFKIQLISFHQLHFRFKSRRCKWLCRQIFHRKQPCTYSR